MDKLYKALADPTRRQILSLLREHDLTAGEIAAEFPMAFASVSHHLGTLKDAGLVLTVREGPKLKFSGERPKLHGTPSSVCGGALSRAAPGAAHTPRPC